MPELPEVESLRRSLMPHLIGAKVTDAQLLRADVCESIDGHGRGHRTSAPDLLRGTRIVELTRRGKQLSIIADDGRVLCAHLGMSGQLLVRHRNAALTNNHIHAYWLMKHADGSTTRLCFRDPRRFGGLWTFPSVAALLTHRWNALGPDALDITASHLHAAAAPSRRAIKALLLDQSVLAGVGNIYADEALFEAGVSPRQSSRSVSLPALERLAAALRAILAEAISRGGSTLRDYRDADGNSGTATLTHRVYGRGGLPCVRCGRQLTVGVVAQRTTVWCRQCQRGPNKQAISAISKLATL